MINVAYPIIGKKKNSLLMKSLLQEFLQAANMLKLLKDLLPNIPVRNSVLQMPMELPLFIQHF